MSRVAKSPIEVPAGVKITLNGQHVSVKGSNGMLEMDLHPGVGVEQNDNILTFKAKTEKDWGMAGTMRSLVSNMVTGVSTGYERKLQLVGVGYRAKASGNTLNLTLGFSHPVDYQLPEGVKAETPSVTEIILKGADKQQLGQAAAEIRAFRPPEPYKGKGIRYVDEQIVRKEAKKK